MGLLAAAAPALGSTCRLARLDAAARLYTTQHRGERPPTRCRVGDVFDDFDAVGLPPGVPVEVCRKAVVCGRWMWELRVGSETFFTPTSHAAPVEPRHEREQRPRLEAEPVDAMCALMRVVSRDVPFFTTARREPRLEDPVSGWRVLPEGASVGVCRTAGGMAVAHVAGQVGLIAPRSLAPSCRSLGVGYFERGRSLCRTPVWRARTRRMTWLHPLGAARGEAPTSVIPADEAVVVERVLAGSAGRQPWYLVGYGGARGLVPGDAIAMEPGIEGRVSPQPPAGCQVTVQTAVVTCRLRLVRDDGAAPSGTTAAASGEPPAVMTVEPGTRVLVDPAAPDRASYLGASFRLPRGACLAQGAQPGRLDLAFDLERYAVGGGGPSCSVEAELAEVPRVEAARPELQPAPDLARIRQLAPELAVLDNMPRRWPDLFPPRGLILADLVWFHAAGASSAFLAALTGGEGALRSEFARSVQRELEHRRAGAAAGGLADGRVPDRGPPPEGSSERLQRALARLASGPSEFGASSEAVAVALEAWGLPTLARELYLDALDAAREAGRAASAVSVEGYERTAREASPSPRFLPHARGPCEAGQTRFCRLGLQASVEEGAAAPIEALAGAIARDPAADARARAAAAAAFARLGDTRRAAAELARALPTAGEECSACSARYVAVEVQLARVAATIDEVDAAYAVLRDLPAGVLATQLELALYVLQATERDEEAARLLDAVRWKADAPDGEQLVLFEGARLLERMCQFDASDALVEVLQGSLERTGRWLRALPSAGVTTPERYFAALEDVLAAEPPRGGLPAPLRELSRCESACGQWRRTRDELRRLGAWSVEREVELPPALQRNLLGLLRRDELVCMEEIRGAHAALASQVAGLREQLDLLRADRLGHEVEETDAALALSDRLNEVARSRAEADAEAEPGGWADRLGEVALPRAVGSVVARQAPHVTPRYCETRALATGEDPVAWLVAEDLRCLQRSIDAGASSAELELVLRYLPALQLVMPHEVDALDASRAARRFIRDHLARSQHPSRSCCISSRVSLLAESP